MGHIISKTGIVVDLENIKAIEYCPTPTTVTDIRSFLGLAGYYQNFIENFLRIACHINTLQKKENRFLCTTKWEESFQNLKQLLTTTSILWIADLDGNFIVFIDASKERLKGNLL